MYNFKFIKFNMNYKINPFQIEKDHFFENVMYLYVLYTRGKKQCWFVDGQLIIEISKNI